MNSRLGFDLLPDIACLPKPPVVVVQMHAEEPKQTGYVRYVTRRYGNLIDAFSVTSQHLKDAVSGYEIPPSRIEVIQSGVDGEEEFNPGRVEPLPLRGDGVPRILWPGRLVEQKDPMLTLDVIACARERGGEFVLDIVGDGTDEGVRPGRAPRRSASPTSSSGIRHRCRWPRWYRSADLLLMTSAFEGVPYVIYESLAMGVPVVAPALPGNVEFMDSNSGVLVDPRDDANRYAEAIVVLLGDETRRVEIGERSRRRMLAEFSLAGMGQRHDELYGRLLESRPASTLSRGDELFGGEDEGPESSVGAAASAPLTLPRDPAPEPTVGVIVPCFRHGIYLDECIDSIKAQSLAPKSIVVADDDSDDPETIEALERLDRDPDVTVLRQAVNAGPSAARNRALEEIDASYVLPIDADDKLLPDALERMVTRLEAAPENVGFVYPHARHFGNRSDYMRLAAYNLWLLMEENFLPAACLFDRRVFGPGGVAYPEDVVIGHEDWDLLLQLAERGIFGLHADGPTFLYRRHGFSRVNSVEYGPHSFQETLERRHPSLYRNRDAIKAKWAPALSLVLYDEGGRSWSEADLSDLPSQTCRDFEVLASSKLASAVRAVDGQGVAPEAWLQEAIHLGLGRWMCLLTPPTAPVLRNPGFVEQLIYALGADREASAIAMGDPSEVTRHALSRLDDVERLAAQPVGLAFERPHSTLLPEVALESRHGVLIDLIMDMQLRDGVQWRVVPVADESIQREAPARSGGRPARLDINHGRTGDRSEVAMRDAVGSEAPRLPEQTVGSVRRWDRSPAWTPPETRLLYRHAELDGEDRIASNDPKPPRGYRLEFVLGAVRTYAAPGARRLVQTGEEFELSDNQNELEAGQWGFGYVEQQPLPMLERLELRTLPATGRQVLVAGPDDPLNEVAHPLATLGWLEAHPILPRHEPPHTGIWGLVSLGRQADPRTLRHRYLVSPPNGKLDGVALGFFYGLAADGFVALRLREDGRLSTDLAQPSRASRDPRTIAGWVAGPLKEIPRRSPRAAAQDARNRLRHSARHREGRDLSKDQGATLGWLRREGAPGWSPLFSATHPVTGDQLVCRSRQEATDAGYLVDGALGFILNAGADHLAP